MRKYLFFLLSLFAISSISTASQAKTLKVEDSSVGVWSIWAENAEALSSQYAGFIKYKKEGSYQLAKTNKYFANHIARLNRDELNRQLNRGCQRGFFRCLLLGTQLNLPTISQQVSESSTSKKTREAEAATQFQTHNLANQDSQAINGEIVSRNESALNSEKNAYHNLPKVHQLMTRKASSDDVDKQGNTSDKTEKVRSDRTEIRNSLENSVFSESEERLARETEMNSLLRPRVNRKRRDKPGPNNGGQHSKRTNSIEVVANETKKETAMDRFLSALFGNLTLQIILGFGVFFFLFCLWYDYGRDWYKRYILGKQRVHKLKRYMYRRDDT